MANSTIPLSNTTSSTISYSISTQQGGLTTLEKDIIAYWVQTATHLGYPRSVGEIYGVIFISAKPITADDLVTTLGISRSGAGQGLKALLDFGAIQPVHNMTDRREHYQMQGDLGVLIKQFLNVRVFPVLEDLHRQRDSLAETVGQTGADHLKHRFDKLQRWQQKSAPIISVLKTLVG